MHIRRSHKFWLWAGVAIATFVGICLFSPARALFDEAFLIKEFKLLGDFAPLFFVLLFAVALTLGFPGNVLAVVGGAVFGLGWGTFWSLLGSTFGAVGAFCVARLLLHGWIKRHYENLPLLQRLNRAIAHHPFTFVLAIRFSPLSPFSLVNFLFGLTPINLTTYTVATFVGLIPLTLAYCWLGVSGSAVLHGGNHVSFLLALGFLTLLSILPMLAKRVKR